MTTETPDKREQLWIPVDRETIQREREREQMVSTVVSSISTKPWNVWGIMLENLCHHKELQYPYDLCRTGVVSSQITTVPI